jgi:hypothetical protein
MTMAYSPQRDWTREDAAELANEHGLRPVHGPLLDCDLCDVDMGNGYCHRPAALEFIDRHGASWLACACHAARILRYT